MDSGLRSAALRLRWAVMAGLGLLLLIFLAIQLGEPVTGIHVEYRVHGLGERGTRLVAAGTLLLLVLAGLRLVQMLGRIAAGELFSAEVVRRFRGFAFWLLAMALLDFLAPLAAGLASAGPGAPHSIALVFDTRELLIVAITMLLFLVARLLERARAIEAEMQEFV